MTLDDPEAIARAVDAAAAAIGLPLDPAHRPGVLRFYALAAAMARDVLAVPLGRDDESGAVFHPVEQQARDGGR
jgi:Protein of unknown function (DUF4089)